MSLLQAPVVTLDESTHTYAVDGRAVAWTVTGVLRDAGLIDFSSVPSETLIAAQARGQRVHKACHYLTEGRLDWATVAPEDRPRVEAAAEFLRLSGFEVAGQERRIYLASMDLAGTKDLYGWWEGKPAIADWKSGKLEDVACDLQLGAYAEMTRLDPPSEWFGFTPATPITRIGVALRKDGTFGTEFYTDPRDWSRFLLAYQFLQLRRSRRR